MAKQQVNTLPNSWTSMCCCQIKRLARHTLILKQQHANFMFVSRCHQQGMCVWHGREDRLLPVSPQACVLHATTLQQAAAAFGWTRQYAHPSFLQVQQQVICSSRIVPAVVLDTPPVHGGLAPFVLPGVDHPSQGYSPCIVTGQHPVLHHIPSHAVCCPPTCPPVPQGWTTNYCISLHTQHS